jgi:hypothetical protein
MPSVNPQAIIFDNTLALHSSSGVGGEEVAMLEQFAQPFFCNMPQEYQKSFEGKKIH